MFGGVVCEIGLIHRHTGGLETSKKFVALQEFIHRHTGGLENG